MKKLNPNFKEAKSPDAIGELKDWVVLISSGKASEYTKLKADEDYQKISAEQQKYAKEILQLKNIEEEFCHYDAIELAKIATPENIDRIKELLQLKINGNSMRSSAVEELLNFPIERQNKAIDIVKENGLNPNRIIGVIKLTEVYEYLPKDVLKDNPNFFVITALDGAAGNKVSRDAKESFLYKPGKGLVEITKVDSETNQNTIISLEQNCVQRVQFRKTPDDENFVEQENIKKYDNLEYDEKTGAWKTGNLLETRVFSRQDSESIPTIKVILADGTEKILQQATVLEDGTLSVEKNFTSPEGTLTKVDYKDSPNGLTTMNYNITDKNGNVVMNRELSIEQKSENKFITTVNNKEYEVVFVGSRLFITDRANDKTKSFDISKKFITEGRDFILEILEKVPANLLMTMDKLPINSISLDVDNSSHYANNARWRKEDRLIELGKYSEVESDIKNNNEENVAEYMLSIFLHEYGHYLDSEISSGESKEISSNPELKRIFEEELEAYSKVSTSCQQNYIFYFINGEGEVRDSQERVAEATMLLNTIPGKSLSTRAAYFQENFPRTIAKINEITNQRLENLT